ncbi:MAG: phosphatase PAP2 family protein [Phaeodactylibacter sp.]|nr:phosphatase PAP2 family protein [Phaeodactylibacter sp.]MCB9051792.1 phosphatase PAP2 family protein [Lewinellaceae bacterium]
MHRFLILLFTALLCQATILEPAKGQGSPYQLNWKKEAALLGAGATTLGAGHLLRAQTVPLSTAEIYSLQYKSITGIDRIAIEQNSPRAYHASNYFLRASFALPLMFAAEKQARHALPTIALLYSETMMLNSGLTLLAKSAVLRPRPFVYNYDAGLESKQSLHARSSFFSGHTSNVAANTFFAAKVFSDFYPESKWKPLVWGIAATAPAITGYLRVKAGKHYPSDVMCGYAVGALAGYFIPHLHKKDGNLKVYGGPGGAAVQLDF